jgi:hypothetical protein
MPRSIARRWCQVVLLFRRAERWFTSRSEDAFAFWPASRTEERLERMNQRYDQTAGLSAQRSGQFRQQDAQENETSGSGVLRFLGYQFELVRHSA